MEPVWDPSNQSENACEPRGSHLVLTHGSPALPIPHPASPGSPVERQEVGKRQGELGVDFTPFLPPNEAAEQPASNQRREVTPGSSSDKDVVENLRLKNPVCRHDSY